MAFEVEKGTLYVVPTPIGNLGVMTERALTVLKNVEFVAAEDTRVSGKLLNLYGIEANFVSYHEHNKASQGEKLVERLKNGESGAIVTDAGTPAVSDPGEDLVAKCRENGVNVVPLPGACAFVTALAGSGFASRAFCRPIKKSAVRFWTVIKTRKRRSSFTKRRTAWPRLQRSFWILSETGAFARRVSLPN